MEFYAAVRRSVYVEGLSERAAARRFGLARETVRKMLRYRLPPGYRRAKPIRCPKLDAFTGVPTENLIRTVRVTDRADVGPANDGNVSIAAVHSVTTAVPADTAWSA